MLENPFSQIADRLDSIESALFELRQSFPAPDKPSGPMRMREAATYLGVSIQTLYTYIHQGKLKPHKAGKFSLFYREQLDRFICGDQPGQIEPTNFLKTKSPRK